MARCAPTVRKRTLLAVVVALVASATLVWNASQAAFTGTTDNSGNSINSGTVVLGDNDSSSALFTLSNAKPGDSQTKCINVSYTGSLGAQVRLRATSLGTLAPYLTLTVTRGTFSSVPGSGLCTGFTNDSANYTGAGAGVLYNGLLSTFPTTWAAGLVDPSTATSPTAEVWTTNEAHAYRLTVTLNDDNNAQGKSSTPTFTWEARDAGDAGAGSYYAQAVLADNPASFWRLDDTTGTTASDTRGAANGTYTGGVTLNQPGPLDDGAPAPAFDGTSGYVNAGNRYAFSARAAFSVEFWAKRSGPGNFARIIANEAWIPGRTGWMVAYDPWSNNIAFERYENDIYSGVADWTPVPEDMWIHIVATYDGTDLMIYRDGVHKNTSASSLSMSPTGANLTIGGGVPWNHFPGQIANVAIYNHVLSPAQVQAHFNARN